MTIFFIVILLCFCVTLRLIDITYENAEGILSILEATFSNFGVTDWLSKTVAFISDGASVNMDQMKVIGVLLKKECPWLLTIHCWNHRLELAVKNSIMKHKLCNEVLDMLITLHNFYKSSPKHLREVKSVADTLNETFVNLQRCNETRWVTFKVRALSAVIKNYGVIVAHLKDIITGGGDIDNTKAKDILNSITKAQFVLHMLYLEIMLKSLAFLSESLQVDGTDMANAVVLLQSFLSEMDVNEITNKSSQLTELLSSNVVSDVVAKLTKDTDGNTNENTAAEVDNDHLYDKNLFSTPYRKRSRLEPDSEITESCCINYCNVSLNNNVQGIKTFFSNRSKYVESIRNCIELRFADILNDDNPVIAGMVILNVALWPKTTDEMLTFANDYVNNCIIYFKCLLLKRGVNVESILSEWRVVKNLRLKILPHIAANSFWETIFENYFERISNFMHLIYILKVLPIGNAKVEKAFAVMKIVKTDWRSSLSSAALEHLMRIKIEGPEIDKYCAKACVQFFFQKPHKQKKCASIIEGSECDGLDSTDSDSDHDGGVTVVT